MKRQDMKKQSDQKRYTMACPRCGRETMFNMMSDAIDDLGDCYRCQHCGWVFNYRQYYLYRQNNTKHNI